MTATEHLKITGAEDILGYIPHSLGYWPENSLVAITTQGKLLGATLRVDLPPSGATGRTLALAGFTSMVVSYLESDDEADGTLLAFFTPAGSRLPPDAGAPDAGAYAELLGALELGLAGTGMPVKDAWFVGARFWRNAYCTDSSCCVLPGRPVEEIRDSRLNAEMVLRGSSVGAAPDAHPAATAAPRPDPAALEAERRWAQQFSGFKSGRMQFRQVLAVWARVLGGLPGKEPPVELGLELAAYLRATLAVQSWRDAVLVMAAAGPVAAERGAEDFGLFSGGDGPPLPLPPLGAFPAVRLPRATADAGEALPGIPGYGGVLLGQAPRIPDWVLMERLEQVLVQLCGAGSDEARAACLTGRGWIEWCRGKGSYADALFRQAACVCPGYRLAELLAELGRRGTLCGWATRRDAAWRKFPPDTA